MLPTPLISDWSSSARLTSVCLALSLRVNSASSNAASNGSGAMCDDRLRHAADQGGEHDVTEGALVDEAQVRAAVLEPEADPQVLLQRRVLVHDQQLTAHPQVGQQSLFGARQREPQIFATALGGQHRAALEPRGELVGPRHVPPDRAWVQHLRGGDLAADDPLREATPDNFDFRQFRHNQTSLRHFERRPPVLRQPVGWLSRSSRRALMRVHAASAACCSASFLLRPDPSP